MIVIVEINSLKMQKCLLQMTILSDILFAVHHLVFATDCPREKIMIPENIQGLKSQHL